MPFVANGTKLEVETAVPGTFAQITDMVDFSGPENTAAEIDVTNLDDVTGRQYLPGLVDRGSFTASMHFDQSNTQQMQLFTDQVATPPTVRNYRIVYPNGAGGAATGENWFTAFAGFVQTTSRSGGVDSPVILNLSLRITGAVTEDQLTP